MLRKAARRASSVTLTRPSALLVRRWQSSGPAALNFWVGSPELLKRPFVVFKLRRFALPRAAPEFEEFINSIGKTDAIIHDMTKHGITLVAFEDKEKTVDYAAELNGTIFPPRATIEQGGIPLKATPILPSTRPQEWRPHSSGNRDLVLSNFPSFMPLSELPYHEVKEWIEARCGHETMRILPSTRSFTRSDFAEGEMPPAAKAIFDASSREKHVMLTTGECLVQLKVNHRLGAMERLNSLPPADRTYPGAKEPSVFTLPRPIPAPPNSIVWGKSVCASLIPRYVRRSDIDEDAVFDFVVKNLDVRPTKVVVHEWPFYPSQFPQDARPPELDAPDSPGVIQLTSGWVSIEFATKTMRENALEWWNKCCADVPASSKVWFLRALGEWHENNHPWMTWAPREELEKFTAPYKFLRENAESWSPREPAFPNESQDPGTCAPPAVLTRTKKPRAKRGGQAQQESPVQPLGG